MNEIKAKQCKRTNVELLNDKSYWNRFGIIQIIEKGNKLYQEPKLGGKKVYSARNTSPYLDGKNLILVKSTIPLASLPGYRATTNLLILIHTIWKTNLSNSPRMIDLDRS